MGRFITLTGVNPPTTRPRLDVLDPILPETGGALLLVETMHPSQQWAAGVPALTYLAPNIAEAQAQAILGAVETRAAVTTRDFADTSFGGAPYGFVERTPKGGVHVAWTRRDYLTVQAQKGFNLQLPAATRAHLAHADRVGHDIYISLWSKITRPALTDGSTHWASFLGQATSITSSAAWNMADASTPNVAGAHTRVGFADTGNVVGDRRRSIAARLGSSTWSGGTQGSAFTVGSMGTENSFNQARRNAASQVFYRTYIEDLTVSGRTYAQVDAIDAQMHVAAFGVGGRYYGDTFTDPTTVA